MPINGRGDLVDRELLAPLKRIRGIAPDTAKVAAGETDKDAQAAHVGRLPLNRQENLINGQHVDGNSYSFCEGSGVPRYFPVLVTPIRGHNGSMRHRPQAG